MIEQLTIRNFGPIREAQIKVRDLTVFVGPQASGKSLAMQVLSFLRGIEGKLLTESLLLNHDPVETVLSGLKAWLGQPPTLYAEPGTLLRWESTSAVGEAAYELAWNAAGFTLNEPLKRAVARRAQAVDNARLHSRYPESGSRPEQIYVPAGRALFSFIPSYSRLYLQLAPQWPGYVSGFYADLGFALARLWEEQQNEQAAAAAGYGSPEAAAPDWLQQHIAAVMKGKLQYTRETVALDIGAGQGAKRLGPTAFAAGQMEIWPFFAIVQAGLDSHARVYFEEPEAHLHPGAQRGVMEIVAHLVGQGVQFNLTTHSPYILYAINNSLLAQQVLYAGRALPAAIPPEVALDAGQVAAYCFTADGRVQSIMDSEVGLIDEHELDRVADELGADFTRLQEQLEIGA